MPRQVRRGSYLTLPRLLSTHFANAADLDLQLDSGAAKITNNILLRWCWGLTDIADVVLYELPVIAALHPYVSAAVRRLPVHRAAVRHDC